MQTKTSSQKKYTVIHNARLQKMRYNRYWLIFLLLCSVILIAVIYFYNPAPPRYSVITISGVKFIENASKFYGSKKFYIDSFGVTKNKTAVLAEKGDLLSTDRFDFVYDGRQDSIKLFVPGDTLAYMNDHLACIKLKHGVDLIPWFRNMNEDTIKHLQVLTIQRPLTEEYLPFIQFISRKHPQLAISLSNYADAPQYKKDLDLIATLFKPKVLYIELKGKQLSYLDPFQKVEFLNLLLTEKNNQPLPYLASLKQLQITTQDLPFVPSNFFSSNKQLEKLTLNNLADTNVRDSLHFLAPLRKTKNLVLSNSLIPDIDYLATIAPDLTVLNLGDSCYNIQSLVKFRNLKWLGLPYFIQQKEFDELLPRLPDLQVLELQNHTDIKQLNSIQQLKQLKGLVIGSKIEDTISPLTFSQLRYFSIPQTNYNDSLFRTKLIKALPGCIIIPNSGACLGSGWLLLLIPFIASIIAFRSIRDKRKWKYDHETETPPSA